MPGSIDWDEAERLHALGWTHAEIARELGCETVSVGRALRRRGVWTVRRWRRTKRRYGLELYGLWRHLRRRCEDPSHPAYGRYGAEGVRFGRAWRDFDAFYDWAMAEGYEPGLRLVRRNRARNFTPGNCRWVDEEEHRARNPRSQPAKFPIRAFGERKGQMAWARDPRCRVKQPALRDRLAAGWPPEEAISAPPGARPSRRVRPPKALEQPRRPRARIDWKEARRLYRSERLSEAEIARHFGATEDAIARGLARLGVRRQREAPTTSREWRRLETLWRNMLARRGPDGRRIPVASEWRDFEAFRAWAKDSGARKGLWLARKNRRWGYSPGNCEWVSRAEATRRRTKA